MAGSALEQMAVQLRGVLEAVDTATVAVGVARDSFGEARDVVVEATYGTEDAELVEGIEGMAHTVLDLERESDRLDTVRATIERYLASLGLDGSSSEVERVPHDDQAPVAKRPEFGSPEWVAEVGKRISPEAGVHVTTGIGFDDHGNEVGTIRSTVDQLSDQSYRFLEQSRQFPKPLGWRPGDALAVVSHTETKFALWMRRNEVKDLTLVINHPKVCGRPHGCRIAVRTILPRGYTMTVLSSVSGQRWELKGVAQS